MNGRCVVLVVLLAFAGCFGGAAVRVNAISPQPNVDLPKSALSLGLDLGTVPDSFVIPDQNGITEVPVEQWRSTLAAGFANGIAPFFAAARPPDFTLKFLKADLEYTPVAIYERSGGAAAVVARVTYMAQLIDRNGQVVARIKGEALSKNPWVTFGGSESTAAESVSQMFEDIADHELRALSSAGAAALPAADPVPAAQYSPPAGATADCIPACRAGFVCFHGECKSACNPPCPAGEQCTPNGQCLKPGSAISN